MEIETIDPRQTPAARHRRRELQLIFWLGALIVWITSDFQNWGGVIAALLMSVIDHFNQMTPYRICLDSHGLAIRQGPHFLWGTPIEQLAAIEVAPPVKRFGMVVAQKRLIFHKRDGDLYSIACGLFETQALQALLHAARQGMTPEAAPSTDSNHP